MFQKAFMESVYKKANKPSDLLWHSEEPSQFLVKAIQDREQPGRALDLGCGAGVFSVYMAKAGYHVTGLDFIPKALELATTLANANSVDIDWVQADLFQWTPDIKFDIILDSGVFTQFLIKISSKKKS